MGGFGGRERVTHLRQQILLLQETNGRRCRCRGHLGTAEPFIRRGSFHPLETRGHGALSELRKAGKQGGDIHMRSGGLSRTNERWSSYTERQEQSPGMTEESGPSGRVHVGECGQSKGGRRGWASRLRSDSIWKAVGSHGRISSAVTTPICLLEQRQVAVDWNVGRACRLRWPPRWGTAGSQPVGGGSGPAEMGRKRWDGTTDQIPGQYLYVPGPLPSGSLL